MNCVIVSSKYIDSIIVLYLSCFICYKLLQLLKSAHIFSVYTKMRLFKSQKTRGDRAKLFINLNSVHLNKQKTPIPILASDQKFIFVNQCNDNKMIPSFCWWVGKSCFVSVELSEIVGLFRKRICNSKNRSQTPVVLVPLFNDISMFVFYLMPKPSFQKNSSDTA